MLRGLGARFRGIAGLPAIELRIAESDYLALREHLLADPAREQIAMLFCGRHVAADGRIIMLVREVAPVPPQSLEHQSAGHVTIRQEHSAAILSRLRDSGLDLIDVHSHPFTAGAAVFSTTDDNNEAVLARYLSVRLPGRWYGALVFTQGDVDGRLRCLPAAARPFDRLTVAGSPLQVIRPRSARAPAGATAGWAPFARQVLAFGAEGQHRLAAASVAVVGAGGLGSLIAVQLAHLGIGRLVLIDEDTVEPSNLNRLLGATHADAVRRRPKVEVLARYARAVRPGLRVEANRSGIAAPTAWRAAAGCDAVLAAVDNDGARQVINQLALQYLLPLIDAASGIRADGAGRLLEAGGQVRTLLPGGFCLHCIDGLDLTAVARERAPATMRSLYRRRGYVLSEDVPQPSVITLNAAVATEAVNELLALLTGLRPPRPYLLYDMLNARWLELRGARRAGCIACGAGGYTGLGDREPSPAVPAPFMLPRMAVRGDKARRADEHPTPVAAEV